MNEYVLDIEVSRWRAYRRQEAQDIDRRLFIWGRLITVERDSGPGAEDEAALGDHALEDTEMKELDRNVGGREMAIEIKGTMNEEMQHIVGIVMPKPDDRQLQIVLAVTQDFLTEAIGWCANSPGSGAKGLRITLRVLGVAEPWNSNEESLGVVSAKFSIEGVCKQGQ